VSKISRFLIIFLILVLVSCSSREDEFDFKEAYDAHWTQKVATSIAQETTGEAEVANHTSTPEPPKPSPIPTYPPIVGPVPTSQYNVTHPLLLSGAEVNLERVKLIDSEVGWVLSRGERERYSLLRTEDGGYTWRDISPPHQYPKSSYGRELEVHFYDRNIGWVSFYRSSIIWRTEDGGITWDGIQLPYETDVGAYSMIRSNDQNRVWIFQHHNVIGLYKGEEYHSISRSDDGGRTWEAILDPIMDPSLNLGSKTGLVFLDEDYGWLTRSFDGIQAHIGLDVTTDGGETWEFIELPRPDFAPDLLEVCEYGLYNPWIGSRQLGMVRVEVICDHEDEFIWQNYIYRTEDGGGTWTTMDYPRGRLRIIDDQVLFSLSGEILRSENGGENWELIKNVTWRSDLSFSDQNIALGVAYNPENGDKSLIKTYNGCGSFIIITPEVWTSKSLR